MTDRALWQESLFPGVIGARATGLRRKNRHEEQGVLNAVLKVLRMHPRVAMVWRVNSGAYKMPDGRFVRFGFVGCPDIQGMLVGGRTFFIEVKGPKGRLTDDQEFMLAKVRANGGVSGVARSIEDAIRIVEGS